MNASVWRNLSLNEGVLREILPDDSHIVLWLPEERDGNYQYWERISTLPRAEITLEPWLFAVPASKVRARQRLHGFLGRWLQHFRRAAGDLTWLLPNGATAEQVGDRQTGHLLVCGEAGNRLDEARLRSRWPESSRVQQIGPALFLVCGAEQKVRTAVTVSGSPREQGEQVLAAARQAGDRKTAGVALADLGIISLNEGDFRKAADYLQESLEIARDLGDRAAEGDVVGHLGMAVLAMGDGKRGWQLLEQDLAQARAAAEPFAEKAALERLGVACNFLRDPRRSLEFFEQGLAIARRLGDRQHEADLLWLGAIQHADLGARERALDMAQAAVDLLQQMQKPQARVLADHLQKYRATSSRAVLSAPALSFGVSMVGAGLPSAPIPAATSAAGPGLLRMAFSAAKAMTRFVGSGFKTVSAEVRQQRLRTCAACVHHTGLRCKLCGCFTDLKSRLPYENCPIGKWPGPG